VAKGICIKQAACGMRHEACGMGQSRMEIQLVTLEVWPATTTATAFWRPGGMIAMVDGDVLGWFLALVLGPRPLGPPFLGAFFVVFGLGNQPQLPPQTPSTELVISHNSLA